MKKIIAGVMALCLCGGAITTTAATTKTNLVDASAFEVNDMLEDINDNVDPGDMDDDPFLYEDGYTYYVFDGEASIFGYENEDDETVTELNIPETLGGYPVTTISMYYSEKLEDLETVVIPKTVKNIAWGFGSYRKLANIIFEGKPEKIASDAFTDTAWYNAQPDGVIYIDDLALTYKGDVRDNDGVIVIKEGTKKVNDYFLNWNNIYVKSVTLPEGLEEIGDRAFDYCTELESINFPDSIKKIGESAFYNCEKITELKCPASLESIGDYAFEYCKDLAKVTFNDGLKTIGDYAFFACYELEEAILPDSVESLGERCFFICDNLKKAVLPEGLTEIPVGLFGICENLESVNIPESVKVIAEDAFLIDYALTEITLPEGLEEIGNEAFYGCKGLTSIVIPESVKSIGTEAFYGCEELADVTVSETVKLGSNAFARTIWFKDVCGEIDDKVIVSDNVLVYVGEDVRELIIPEGVTAIGEGVCSGKNIKTVSIPDSVKSIGKEAFMYCDSLKEITLPEGLEEIGEDAFDYCGITSVTIPEGVKNISMNAFASCYSLVSVKLPEKLETIDAMAFVGCDKLTDIVIPETVTSIGDFAFAGCDSFSDIIVPGSVEELGCNTFAYCRNLKSITIVNPDCIIYNDPFTICNDTEDLGNDKSAPFYNGIICGYTDSTAYDYAAVSGYTFVDITTKKSIPATILSAPSKEVINYGDANCDGKVTIADATAILQHLGNEDKYGLSEQGRKNADVYGGDGITGMDAITIQQVDANMLSIADLPIKG